MPKVKQGRRHHHSSSRQKYYGRTPLKDVSSTTNNTNTTNTTATINSLEQLDIPQLSQWHICKHTDYDELSFLQSSLNKPSIIKFTVTILKNFQWNAKVYGKTVPSESLYYEELPSIVISADSIRKICSTMQDMSICEGNIDESFIDIIKSKGGSIEKNGAVTAYFETSSNTIRHIKCHFFTKGTSRCCHCSHYRATLRAMLSRAKKSSHDMSTEMSSHTNYRYLQPDTLKIRLKNVMKSKRTADRNILRLNEKLQSLIHDEGIELVEEDASDIGQLIADIDGASTQQSAKSHFQKIFWDQQSKYNSLHDKRNMRWHPLMIRFALNLKYLSSNAYRAVSSFLALPSRRTLCDYTHVMAIDSGVSCEVIERLKNDMNFSTCSDSQKMVSVMLDEMKIKSGLVFNRHTGKIVGFVNLGSICSDLDALQSSLLSEISKPPEIAGSMLVLMVRLLQKPSFTFPVAQYPTSSLTGYKLYPIVWDVIEILELNSLQVHISNSYTCILTKNCSCTLMHAGNESLM